MTETQLATTKGKEFAQQQLLLRREQNKDLHLPDNSSLPAGSRMYFHCQACNGSIDVPENYWSRPTLCAECQALKNLNWLI